MSAVASARARVFAGLALVLAATALAGEPPERKLSELAWLAGSWSTTQGELTIEEHWTRPSENAMLGMGRTLRDGKSVFFEYLRIESRPDGIYYVAQPKGAPGTDFKLTSLDARQVVFENPEHDYPKRIFYRRESGGSLTARTDGGAGEAGEAPQEFKYRRLRN